MRLAYGPGMTKNNKASKSPDPKRSAAAKKAWATRRRNQSAKVKAPGKRQASKILNQIVGGSKATLSGGPESQLFAGARSTAVGGAKSEVTVGAASVAVGGEGSRVEGGANSLLVGGDGATISGGKNSSIVGGELARVKGGVGASFAVRWYNADTRRYRIATATVGEPGIKANTLYRVTNKGEFVEVAN